MKKVIAIISAAALLCGCAGEKKEKTLTDYVNPLLGTATLWKTEDLG